MNFILDKEIKYLKLFISIFFVFWFLYHLITISISPLPNMDEIFFANISDQLNKFNSLTLQLASLPGEKSIPILHYGPVYFYLQSILISNFGLNIVTVRFLSFVSGVIILLGLTYFLFKKIKYPFLVLLFFCVCATDMKFNAGLHSGRMDLLTILFFYSSIYFFVFYKNFVISIFSGILLAAAFLTSPRVVFYFPIFFLLFYYDYINYNKILKKYFIVVIVFLILVLSWIFCTFHSLSRYFDYLLNVKSLSGSPTSLLKSHFGANDIYFYIQNPAFLFYFISIIFLFFKRNFSLSILFPFFLIVLHCIFILERGPYSSMILPVVYMCLIYNCVIIYESFNLAKVFMFIFLLFIINFITFSTKAIFILSDLSSRRPDYVITNLSSHNLANKKILSGFKYYFIVNEINGLFYSCELLSEKITERNIREFDYAIIDENSFLLFSEKYKNSFKKIYPLKLTNGSTNDFKKIIGKKFNIYVDYDGYLIQL